jgi:hypothetical protein
MQNILECVPTHIVQFVQSLRAAVCDLEFSARHRMRPQDFTRNRQLTFPLVMLFILQKTVKSIQLHLHEFLNELAAGELFEPVTASAFTHARAKLKHTAFIELNERSVLPWIYHPEHSARLQRWHGHRLIGVDSSVVRLPNHAELFEHFERIEVTNQLGPTGIVYAQGRISVLYDLLNRVGLDNRFESSQVGEVDLAIEQLAQAAPGDVLMNDRGFTGYRYLAWHHRLGLHYIARCSSQSFLAAQELFRLNRAGRSKIVKISAPAKDRAALRAQGLPLELKMRFVSVRLPNGELEVLATSLLDESVYPTEEFLAVYHYRWNHETFYNIVKSRLDLENFSGETSEAVRQDVYSTFLLCNIETVLTGVVAEELQQRSIAHKHRKQVNRAVAFHALKDQLLPLLYSDIPTEQVVLKLQRLFLGSPVSVRPERKVPRRKHSWHRSYYFQKCVKKFVF